MRSHQLFKQLTNVVGTPELAVRPSKLRPGENFEPTACNISSCHFNDRAWTKSAQQSATPAPYRKLCAAYSNRGLISSRFPRRDRTTGSPCTPTTKRGQTFELFKAQEYKKPDDKLRRMYLQPLGEFLPGHSPSQQTLKEYASVFFAIETETLPAVPVQAFTSRVNGGRMTSCLGRPRQTSV